MRNILRALDCALTAFINELSPYDFPILSDTQDSSARVSASAAEDQVPAGVEPPIAPAGHLTVTDLEDASFAASYRAIYFDQITTPLSWNHWNRLSDKLHAAAQELAE